jgi:integrase/recombinase XerD
MDYLKSYKKMISLRGLTDHTMKSYQTYISAYLNFIENTLCKTRHRSLTKIRDGFLR